MNIVQKAVILIFIISITFSCDNNKNYTEKNKQKKSNSIKSKNESNTTENKFSLIQKRRDSIKSFRENLFNEKNKNKKTFFVNEIECFWYYNPKFKNEISLYGKPKRYQDHIFNLIILSNWEEPEKFEKKWYNNQIDSEFKDVNFDGKKDFVIYSEDKSGNGGRFYDVFTFFIKELRFDYSKELSGGILSIDSKTKTATNFWKVGAKQSIEKKFTFRGDGGIYYISTTEKNVKNINYKDYLITNYKKHKHYNKKLIEFKTDTIEFDGW